MEDVEKAPKIDAKLLAEVVEESHAWAVAHGLVMGVPGGAQLLRSFLCAHDGGELPARWAIELLIFGSLGWSTTRR
jgi:hypothetical protein